MNRYDCKVSSKTSAGEGLIVSLQVTNYSLNHPEDW